MSASPIPAAGQVVRVRQRQWVVDEVLAGRTESEAHVVRLSCLDDDAPGEACSVLWEHEVDAQAAPAEAALGQHLDRLDPPAMFGAYLHALRWNAVTSTDKTLLQAPFRAGIDLKTWQLEPLRKALGLPKVNLFIADDVGLGKTIEAGLILQELILRQRVERVLIVCPPAVTGQWREEMDQRFGLSFEVYDSPFVASRRRERGWGVNPWQTHSRFIVSYALLRGSRGKGRWTPHLELLLQSLGKADERPQKTLLILDECHQVAPAGNGLWPVDSQTTQAIRQLAPRFEHRLFLSATPHNGHSHSFSALLELLDPLRFTRGVKVGSADELAPVMVRRLKRDLRHEVEGLPTRHLVDHEVHAEPDDIGLRLGALLRFYDALYRQALADRSAKDQAARSLVLVGLHKRLLSSVPAFTRTLQVHARSLTRAPIAIGPAPDRADLGGDSDEALDQRDDEFVESASFDAGPQAREVLDQMLSLAKGHQGLPDGRAKALAAWIKAELRPGGAWNHRRVVVFTEYDDTLQWLYRVLREALSDHEGRIERYHGGLGEARREALRAAFNTDPGAHPLRVLLCTDAAREGLNLQAHCRDLFHFDLPWNPSRIEQRNGRIDRVLQPEPDVYCRYFVVSQRSEDKVLAYLFRKLETIRQELGAVPEVLSERLAELFAPGLREVAVDQIDDASEMPEGLRRAWAELEGQGSRALREDIEVLRDQLAHSQRHLAWRREHLRDVVDLGLKLAVGQGLTAVSPPTNPESWRLPELPASWGPVLEPLREPVPDDAPPWFRAAVRPVAVRAAHKLDADTVQLHLGHPLVARILARFRAQGFAAHDLVRVTAVPNPRDPVRRLVLFGRLSLFGAGASRLHEEILALSAPLRGDAAPVAEPGDSRPVELLWDLLADAVDREVGPVAERQVRTRAGGDFRALWPALQAAGAEAEARARAALQARGEEEASDLRALLSAQRGAIHAALGELPDADALRALPPAERDQLSRDRRAMEARLRALDSEERTEPLALSQGYAVTLSRLTPVGLCYLWPES